jgi:hypothetical protein
MSIAADVRTNALVSDTEQKYSYGVPLLTIEAAHVRVVCDACRTASAELCGKRTLPLAARATAITKFQAAGWHHDPDVSERIKRYEQAAREGTGRWYCPTCARRTHL